MSSRTGERIHPSPSLREQSLLWLLVLGPPLAWSLGLALDYALVRAACPGSSVLLHLVTLVTFTAAASAGIRAWRGWGRASEARLESRELEAGRTRFMLAVAVMGGAFFSFAILAQWVPTLFLSPCVAV